MIITLKIEDGKQIEVTVNDDRAHDISKVGFIDADKKEDTCKWKFIDKCVDLLCEQPHEKGLKRWILTGENMITFCPICGKRIEVVA